jgi:eukaryotic-like serine/threonine-protein kinase
VSRRGAALPGPAVLKIVSLACEGLSYAHEFTDESGQKLELVHRDISPDNLLLSRQGSVKVADFGIAKAVNLPSLTKTGTLKGKLNYMPPEQLMGQPLDRRSDVFALGVVLHETLAGTKPFDATSEVSAMRSILQDEPKRLAELRGDLPPGVQQVVDRALAKDRQKRYPDCRAFQSDIENLLMKLGTSVRAMDIAELVERDFPRQPLPAETPSEETLEKSLAVSLSMVIAAGAPEPRTDTGPIELSARKPSRPQVHEVTSLTALNARTAGMRPPAPRPSTRTAKRRTSSGRWIAGLVALALGAGGALAWGRLHPLAHPAAKETPPAPVARAPQLPPEPKQAQAIPSAAPVPRPAPAVSPKVEVPVAAAPVAKAEPAPANQPLRANPPKHSRHQPARNPEPAPPRHPDAPRQIGVIPVAASPAPAPGASSPAPVEPGRLAVHVQPWAEIIVDGQSYGVTPIRPITLLAGKHQVQLKNSDLRVDRTVTITVQAGQQAEMKINLAQ